MRNIIRPALIAAAAVGITITPSAAKERPKGEERLAEMLEGREAGEPQRCIRTLPSQSLTIIDGTAIVSKRGGTIYVNRTRNPESLDDDDTLVIRKFGSASQLCRLDTVTTIDRYSQFYTGNIFLGDFVPYRRVDDDDSQGS